MEFFDKTTYKEDFQNKNLSKSFERKHPVCFKEVDTRRCLIPDLQKKKKERKSRLQSENRRRLYNGDGTIWGLVRRGTVDIEGFYFF